MKRITALLVAMVMAFGSVGIADTAQANNIDIKARGEWQFAFGYMDNSHFGKSFNPTSNRGSEAAGFGERNPETINDERRRGGYDNFEALQRVRVQVNFISSEYLQGLLHFEIGGMNWGRGSGAGGTGAQQGAGLDADGINIKTKRAFLDWIIPNTQVSVRMGIQGVALPSNRMGNPVFDADVAGITVNCPITNNFGLTAFWLRPFGDNRRVQTNDTFQSVNNETDVFGLVAPVTFSGVSFSPYFVYANIGNGQNRDARGFWSNTFNEIPNSTRANSSANAWWIGANLNVDILDPLVFSLDAIYGAIANTRHSRIFHENADNPSGHGKISASGWYISSTLDYKLDWGTPGIFGWYSSGDKSNAFGTVHTDDGEVTCAQRVRSGRLPVLGTNGGFLPTSFGFPGYYGIGNGGGLNEAVISHTGTGTWGIGIQLADVSFIQDLSHTLRFAYYQGTNSAGHYTWGDGYVGRGGNVRSTLKYNVDPMYLTTKDSVFEVNFDHVYKIYENLEVALELGWLRLSSDRRTWGSVPGDGLRKNDDAFKAGLNFTYSF